ncbi:MAG: sigma-70 family RNA polymerase sigma factor [Magnetococcales bacterium]|nr:sigma-70 family RNA polymerase sigma factor [Magnetococcales bacterium]
MMVSEDYKKSFFDHWSLLERLTQRRFPDQNLRDLAILFVQEAMAKNNWERLRAFQGRSSFATFFGHVTHRLLEDFARSRHGRPHIPAWIKEAGEFWQDIYRMLCLERLPAIQIVEMVRISAPGERSQAAVETAISVIFGKEPNCGATATDEIAIEDSVLEGMAHRNDELSVPSPEEERMIQEGRRILNLFYCFLTEENGVRIGAGRRIEGQAFLERLRTHLTLSTEERLLLKLLYRDELRVDAVAKLLGMTTHQIYGRQRRLLTRIRQGVAKAGLTEDLLALLNLAEEN